MDYSALSEEQWDELLSVWEAPVPRLVIRICADDNPKLLKSREDRFNYIVKP